MLIESAFDLQSIVAALVSAGAVFAVMQYKVSRLRKELDEHLKDAPDVRADLAVLKNEIHHLREDVREIKAKV